MIIQPCDCYIGTVGPSAWPLTSMPESTLMRK